jgi:uncharacterized protein (UPF0261 family)
MAKTILIIGTLDTKAKELAYLRKRIEAEGVKSLLMDVGCKSEPSEQSADVSCNTVAEESGKDFSEVMQLDKISAVKQMTQGAINIVKKMWEEKQIHAVIGLGGANGAEISCDVMRTLPIGFPKLMVTCVASGNTRPYVGTKDIMMANSIGDISLNRITKRVIRNAARAIAHMADEASVEDEELKPQICMTTFGTTMACVERAKCLLEEKGFEVIELHASGTGGMALEELVLSGEVSGVLDITTSELVDDLVEGMYSAGPNRLEAAASTGVPQVISLGALDFGNFGPKETVPAAYRDRNFFFYAPSITLMRTNVEENEILGKKIAAKANASTGPVAIIVPQKGFSVLDRAGGKKMTRIDGTVAGEWHDQAANSALIESIKKHLDTRKVQFVEVAAHINDPDFAEKAVDLLVSMMKIRKSD